MNESTAPLPGDVGISLRRLSEEMQERDRAQGVPLFSSLKDVRAAVTAAHHAQAKRLVPLLAARGFKESHLDDLIYELAEKICSALSSSTACDNEYIIANEINTEPMAAQVAVLAVVSEGDNALVARLERHLGVVLRVPL